MGASFWSYFTPFEADVDKALADLQQRVFAAGDYYCVRLKEGNQKPKTIQELVELAAEDGTHSILDVCGFTSDESEILELFPLKNEELQRLFGTIEPTRELVLEKEDELNHWLESYFCRYFTVYRDGRPGEIYFCGWTGD